MWTPIPLPDGSDGVENNEHRVTTHWNDGTTTEDICDCGISLDHTEWKSSTEAQTDTTDSKEN